MPKPLLVEIGCEEIPAHLAEPLARQFAGQLDQRLSAAGLVSVPGAADWTPRRLIYRHPAVLETQPDREEEILGPPVRVAIAADGGFTPQALGFAARNQMAPAALYRQTTPKGEYLAARKTVAGNAAAVLLSAIISQAFSEVQAPRTMRWQAASSEPELRFIRPVRWLLALWGEDLVSVQLGSLRATAESWGHRSLGGGFSVPSPAAYPSLWLEHFVVASAAEREARILAAAVAVLPPGLRLRADPGLLHTLVNLTEYPDVILGGFDAGYLAALPAEVLVTVMRDHQKYFAVEDAAGRLAPYFLAIINQNGDPKGFIRHGNERVLRARFSDAQFFWNQDRKLTLSERLPQLDQVSFHARLGSYRQKSRRLRTLAAYLATLWPEVPPVLAESAAELAKCDLTTEMVKEFTELQGVMGGNYARAEGLDAALADAIADQYLWDTPPRTALGAAVGVADKLDTLAGMFAIGELPTGSADPFSLRRQANAVVRTLIERRLELSLAEACDRALAGYGPPQPGERAGDPGGEAAGFRPRDQVRAELAAFFRERLAFYLREAAGFTPDVVAAVLAAGADRPLDAAARCQALASAPQVAAVAAVMKRAGNIVRRERWTATTVEPDLLSAPAEQALLYALEAIPAGQGYAAELQAIAQLAAPLERFFNEVRVNDDDPALRANRLSLLASTVARLARLADFSELSPPAPAAGASAPPAPAAAPAP